MRRYEKGFAFSEGGELTQGSNTKVTIGSRVLFGPGVHIYAATHGEDPAERAAALAVGKPVTIGDDGKLIQQLVLLRLIVVRSSVWIGGGAKVVGPCTIGEGCIVAAGAVAKGALEPYCMYAGKSC